MVQFYLSSYDRLLTILCPYSLTHLLRHEEVCDHFLSSLHTISYLMELHLHCQKVEARGLLSGEVPRFDPREPLRGEPLVGRVFGQIHLVVPLRAGPGPLVAGQPLAHVPRHEACVTSYAQ